MNAEPAQIDPDELLDRAQHGDGAALDRLFALYRAYLVTLARPQIQRRLQGKVDASDLAQEALLEAHQGFATFRGNASPQFAAWLRGILAHRLSRHVRHYVGTQRRDAALERSLVVELENASSILDRGLVQTGATPSEAVAKRESNVFVAVALESLPDDYRQVILLRHFEALPFAQVADAMGRSVDSVEKLWVRALAQLRRAVGNRHA